MNNDINSLTDLEEGYALKRIKINSIKDHAKSEAEEFFIKHRSMNPPRRACPRAFSQLMATMRHKDGKYKFEV